MPLIIVTGLPCSGKTHRTSQILADLQHRIAIDPALAKRTVHIVPAYHASQDSSYGSPDLTSRSTQRDKVYNSAAAEKTARAEEFSAIKRTLSKDNIVIADSLNYIKGYRYQLWCEAKAAGTRCCVVHVAAQEDECREWNRERLRAWGRGNDIENGGESTEEHDKSTGPKIGRDVIGELEPESHTAIYGDRVVKQAARSRSSSMDGASDDEAYNKRNADDTMTLKSLYIGGGTEDAAPNLNNSTLHANSANLNPSLPSVASSIPPPPSSAGPYLPSTLTSLIMRYEPPSPFSRWDTPLFTIPTADTHPPCESIWTALFPPNRDPISKKSSNKVSSTSSPTTSGAAVEPVKQHAATILPSATNADALQVIESTTLDVVKALLASARDQGLANGEGGDVSFTLPTSPMVSSTSNANGTNDAGGEANGGIQITLPLPPGMTLNQPMLQRLRRKYTQIQRGGIAHGRGHVTGRKKVVEGFVRFLEGEFGEG